MFQNRQSGHSHAYVIWDLAMIAAVTVLSCAAAGCQQEMANQPRYRPLSPSLAFADGAASRPQVPGTVARAQLQDNEAFFTGKSAGQLVTDIPARALQDRTMSELLHRGQKRFNVFCSHCHGE